MGNEISWDAARSTNLDNWEDRVPLHEAAYSLGAFDDPDYLSSVVRADLAAMAPFLPDGVMDGLDVCHLQCHIGTDTLSLARAGARVTGVDFSPTMRPRMREAARWSTRGLTSGRIPSPRSSCR
ncbi:bifunctional 2-polyprenyl-6-hydroxyphenol methylase/3-demethylubiquinol 3-O-methyltransferase UbiG [Arthrobacter echini]|uniref:class I SAM-dependent methyltransferase n=1 Tax=Arthrobacter echini TaxID=1529066 RepID=UPI0021CC990B|nr:class I SAM-dependent methyltransferase [Arthrobacter echini]